MRNHRFDVETFAKKNECKLVNLDAVNEVSAAIQAGEPVGFYSEFPYEGELPEGLVLCEAGEELPRAGVAVTIYEECRPFQETVQVIPKIVTLGMDCKNGTDLQTISNAAIASLLRRNLNMRAFEQLASSSLKKDEPGLTEFAASWGRPFLTFDAEELKAVEGGFPFTEVVSDDAGMDNVCERSAVLASGGGALILRKNEQNKVTTALAVRDYVMHF